MGAVGKLLAKVVPERGSMMFSSVLPDLDPVAFALLCFLGGVLLRVLLNVLLSVARPAKPAVPAKKKQ